jgi:hypothetical protein
MRLLLVLPIGLLSSCAGEHGPNMSVIAQAPDSVQDSIDIQHNCDPPRVTAAVSVFLPPPKEHGWVDLAVVIRDDHVFTNGYIAYSDDSVFVPLEDIRVDTGFDGFLLFPLRHWAVENVWVSAEVGRSSLAAVGGRKPMWAGAVPGFALANIVMSPTPLTVISDPSGWPSRNSPLLGQMWFDVAEATWIDVAADTIAVSFETKSAANLVQKDPTLWVKLPWRKATPGGHRSLPISVGDQEYRAIIDTGSVAELFLETVHPPPMVERPWVRGRLAGAPTGSIFRAPSNVPLMLGEHEVHDIEISWTSRRSEFFADLGSDQPSALLGVPFLRRFPLLLDHRNDIAYFFIGDRGALPRIYESGADLDGRIDPTTANDKPQMRSMFPGS